MAIVGPLVLLVLVVGSCSLAVWIATHVPWTAVAFLVAWILTPLALLLGTILMIPLFRALVSSNNDGTWIIMIPIYGVPLGLISGIVAAVKVSSRRKKADGPSVPGGEDVAAK